MRIVVISDVHGRKRWKYIYDEEKFKSDYFIFLGDYLDSKKPERTVEKQIKNLNNIISLSKEVSNISLLIGNHDIQYVRGARTNGYNKEIESYAKDIFTNLLDNKLVKPIEVIDNYIFSHAGVSSLWMTEQGIESVDDISTRFYNDNSIMDFSIRNGTNLSGDNVYQSPIWIRPYSLLSSLPVGYNQVVGHTRQKDITRVEVNGNIVVFADAELYKYVVIDTSTGDIEVKTTPLK